VAKHQEYEKYLEPLQYYEDRYDLQTIETCIRWIKNLQKKLPEVMKKSEPHGIPEEKQRNDWLRATNIVIHSVKIERFENKEQTLNKWISEDRTKQDRYDNATPAEVYCPKCTALMPDCLKTLHDFANKPLRVLFFYECPRCNYREGRFDDGKKYESSPTLCENCGSEIKVSIEENEKEDETIWIYKCTECNYKRVEVDNHREWKLEQEQKKRSDKELLAKHRSEFCFTEKEGNEAVLHRKQLTNLVDSWEEQEEKKADPAYQKAKQLKKLTVAQLQKLLDKKLTEENFINLQFEGPEMGRYVVVPFTAQEADSDREEYDSRNQLKKLVKMALDGTNWRLMSDGVSYRLGYLSGRLKGRENEEELMKLVK